jgi:hypothetical protein
MIIALILTVVLMRTNLKEEEGFTSFGEVFGYIFVGIIAVVVTFAFIMMIITGR